MSIFALTCIVALIYTAFKNIIGYFHKKKLIRIKKQNIEDFEEKMKIYKEKLLKKKDRASSAPQPRGLEPI